MSDVFLLGIARPFIALILVVVFALPVKWAVQKWMPEGKLKRILLFSWKV